MRTFVFFLEEPSAKEMLQGVLPRILPAGISIRFVIFQGKQDLEKNLNIKLRAWKLPNCSFVVMRDQDSGDCKKIKENLANICEQAGKKGVLIRIACHELESFYLGDLTAVEKGLDLKGLERKKKQRKFRNPDLLTNPSEEMFKLTNNIYDKVSGSRAIAPYLALESNTSKSFNTLISGIKKLI
ncbi:DUF4276 family protein [Desulfobacter postgatei]|uniref:DUF4276 family protein n=1 Tax=Desulfobacter postgatei TaxID=2293 RepID=UPI00259AF7B3|nr:DUF4276 family protein [uncultured Desulfobacter sp.]